jgi:hypothetical protein
LSTSGDTGFCAGAGIVAGGELLGEGAGAGAGATTGGVGIGLLAIGGKGTGFVVFLPPQPAKVRHAMHKQHNINDKLFLFIWYSLLSTILTCCH